MSNGGSYLVGTAVGFVPVAGIPRQDYQDFMLRGFSRRELRSDLQQGVLPPGLVIADDDGTIALVRGQYGTPQSLMMFDAKVLLDGGNL